MSPAVVDAIRRGVRPVFDRKDEEAAYNYASELHANKRVSDATYQALVDEVGAQGAIELTAITGFYTTIAMLLVAFEIDAPAEAGPQLEAPRPRATRVNNPTTNPRSTAFVFTGPPSYLRRRRRAA